MYKTTEFNSLKFFDICSTILSLLFGLIVYFLVKFYIKIKSLPPGPTPLPIVGNLLLFRGTTRHQCLEVIDISKKYGPIFTLWMGPKPFVYIMDLEVAKEAFNRNELSGRPDSLFGKLVCNEKYSDILFADYSPKWMSLRRVAHLAVKKYSTTDKFADLVSEVVDHTVRQIIDREGVNKLFSPFDYIYNLFLNIMATSAFGKKYDIEDEEFKKLNYIFRDFFQENTLRFLIMEFIPNLHFIDRNIVKKREEFMNETRDLVKSKYIYHYKDFNESIIRDFCDALIVAKNEALAESKESAPYLNDDNLTMVLWDLFIAGVDTTHNTFKWILFLLAFYPNIQKQLRQEIDSQIGDRMPVQEDRSRCHYVMAFISETIRYRTVAPQGVYHKAVVDTLIGEHRIPKGTGVFVHQYSILNDQKYWSNGNQFIPERFLENGKYLTSRPTAFIPFGLGRRVCLGQKLAINELFMVLVRFIQSTNDYDIVLQSDVDVEPNPIINDSITPKDYKIQLKPIKS